MKIFWVLAAVVFSSTAFAQDVPKIGSKSLVQAKPKGPIGCKMLGTVKGNEAMGRRLHGLRNQQRAARDRPPTVAARSDHRGHSSQSEAIGEE